MVPGDVDLSIIEKESMFLCDPLLMSKGASDALVPESFLSEGILDLVMELSRCGHD